MLKRNSIILFSVFSLILATLACNLPQTAQSVSNANPSNALTVVTSATPSSTSISSLTSTEPEAQSTPTASSTPVAATNTTGAPTLTPTPQNPLVTTTAYCWSGPTDKTLKYELISSIQAGTRVQLLGRGSVDGWWIVKNPRYGDPCWIQQQDVQIDLSYDLSTLKVFAIPATPTETP